MISARHYTPGMYVDVIGKTVGHGFQGTIKRYGFRRQPATHGNSVTTRVLGSTGGRQDPGRVFKQKKMDGRMGGKMDVQRGLAIFKIDVDKNRELADALRVKGLPTLMIYKEGQMVWRQSGELDANTLISLVQEQA